MAFVVGVAVCLYFVITDRDDFDRPRNGVIVFAAVILTHLIEKGLSA